MRDTIKHGDIIENKFLRILFYILGWAFLITGIIGIVVPFLPGVLFMLIAAYFFARSSKRFHSWLLTNRFFGHHVTAFAHGAKMPLRAKIMTAVLITVSVGVGLYFRFMK